MQRLTIITWILFGFLWPMAAWAEEAHDVEKVKGSIYERNATNQESDLDSQKRLVAARRQLTDEEIEKQRLDNLQTQFGILLVVVESAVKEIEINRNRYVRTAARPEGEHFEARFEAALFYYKEKDYTTTAIQLGDLLQFKDVKQRPEYYKIVYLLGDCHFKNSHFALAVPHLKATVEAGASGEHYNVALLKLVDSYLNLNKFTEAEKYYSMVKSQGGENFEEIQFNFAKSLYIRGALEQAFKVFSNVPPQSPRRWPADYHLGAIRIRQAKAAIAKEDIEGAKKFIDEALVIFDKLSARTAVSNEQDRIRELAVLASARIRAHLGQYDEAMKLYRSISSRSPFFDEALYETAWILIEREMYQQAENVIEIMLVTVPDSMFVPETNLLKGGILMRQANYPEAELQFQTILNRYLDIVEKLNVMVVQSKGQPGDKIYANMKAEEKDLPPAVINWMNRTDIVERALALEQEANEGFEETKHSEEVLETLKTYLNQKNKANLFPNQREGREKGQDTRLKLTELEGDLVSLASSLGSDDAQERIKKARKHREDLEERYASIPKTSTERKRLKNKKIAKLAEVQSSLAEMKQQINVELDLLITDIDQRHKAWTQNPDASREKLREIETELANLRKQKKEALSEISKMEADVQKELQAAQIGDREETEDEKLRRELEEAIAEEERLQKNMKLSPRAQVILQKIEVAKDRIGRAKKENEKYLADLEALVAEQVVALQARVRREENVLNAYKEDVRQYKEKTQQLADEVAYYNLRSVRDLFHELVLRADVGIVDIAWEKRERLRAKIDDLLNLRAQEQNVLDSAYKTGH